MNAGDDTGRHESGQAWPFLIGGTRNQASRIIVIPGFLDNPEGVAALNALTAGIQQSPDTTVLRQLQGATGGPVSVIYRSFLAQASDYGLGGGTLTDNFGQPIRLCEGLVLRLTEPDAFALGIGPSDLESGHAAVRDAYQAFWSHGNIFARRQSAPFPVGGSDSRREPAIKLLTADPVVKAPIPEPRGGRKLTEPSALIIAAVIAGIFGIIAAVLTATDVFGFAGSSSQALAGSSASSSNSASPSSSASSGSPASPSAIGGTSPVNSPPPTPSTFPGQNTSGLITLPSAGVDAVAFSVGGDTLAAGNADGLVRVWNAKTWQADGTMTDTSSKGVTSLAFNSANNLLAAGDANGHVYLWNHHLVATLTDPQGAAIRSVAFSHEKSGEFLAIGDVNGMVYAWKSGNSENTAWGTPSVMTDPNSRGVNSVTFNPADSILAAADANGHVYLYGDNGSHPPFLADPAGQALRSVAFTADDVAVVGGDSGGHVYVWNLRSGVATENLVDPNSLGIESVAFDSRSKVIAAADGNGLVYLLLYQLSNTVTLHGPVGFHPLSVAYSPDDHHLAVASSSGKVYVWPVKS